MPKSKKNPDASNASYEVGYGKPPKQYQFAPNTTGNLKGRPKGRKNFHTEVLEELAARVSVTDKGKKRSLSMQSVGIKRLVQDFAKGDPRARDQIFKYLSLFDAAPSRTGDDDRDSAKDKEILAKFRAKLAAEIKGGKK